VANPRIRRWAAVVATAIVLAYVGTVAVTQVRDSALWPADLGWLGAVSAVCGVLLALIDEDTIRLMVVASGLAVLIFAGVWSYILWSLLGDYFSLFELMVSNFFVLQVIPRSAMIFGTTLFMGLLAIVAVTTFVPDRYRP
jgi:preprotein translocase subunit SecY